MSDRMSSQEFMRVYEVLREELLDDDLIAGQPSFSAEYMRKVRTMSSPLHTCLDSKLAPETPGSHTIIQQSS